MGEDLGYYRYDSHTLSYTRPAYNFAGVERGSQSFSCAGYPKQPTTLDNECTHAQLEIWAGQRANRQEYVTQRRSVENGGILTAIGRIGWYTNSFVQDQALEIASYRGLMNPNRTAAFKRPITFGRYDLYSTGSTDVVANATKELRRLRG